MRISSEAIDFLMKKFAQNPDLVLLGFELPTMGCCYVINKPTLLLLDRTAIAQEFSLPPNFNAIPDFEQKELPAISIPVYWHKSIFPAWKNAEIDLTPEQNLILFFHDN
jgi:hypothetical protein